MAHVLNREDKRTLVALWAGILVPPAAWSVHLVLGYFLVTLACHLSWSGLVLDVLLHGLTLLLGVITVGSSVMAWRGGHAGAARENASAGERERRHFMLHSAVALSALFLLLILAGDIPNLFVPACA